MIEWQWELVWELAPRFADATAKTLLAAGGGYGIAVVLGLVLVAMQRAPVPALGMATREFVELIRSTPLLLQIFFVYYVGPQFGLILSPWTAGLIAIGVHYGAYLSEVYRGRHRKRAERPVGSRKGDKPARDRHLPPYHIAAGAAPGHRRYGQLPGRDLQGHAHAVGDRGCGAHAHRHHDRRGELQIP